MSSIALIEDTSSAPRAGKPKPLKNLRRPLRAPISNRKLKTSPRKLAANRQNAQKSTGPRSPQGKHRASQNSLKHALCSQSPLLPNECSATYTTFQQELQESLRPQSPLQHELLHQITSLLWRLQRTHDTERHLYDLRSKNNDPPCLTLAKAFHKNPTANPFPLYQRYERHLRNTYLRLIRELKKLQKEDFEANEYRRRTEPAWSPEKQAAQEARFKAKKPEILFP